MFVIIHVRRDTADVEAVLLAEDEESAIAKALDYTLKSVHTDENPEQIESELRSDHQYASIVGEHDGVDRIFIKRGFKSSPVVGAKP